MNVQRMMVAVVVGLVLILAWNIPLPGLDPSVLSSQTASRHGGISDGFSIFALGLTPLFAALTAVELVRLITGRGGLKGQKAGMVEIVAVGLMAIAVAVIDGQGVVAALRSFAGIVVQDADIFMWLTIISFVAMTALSVFLCYRVRMPGFRQCFWLLWSVSILMGMPSQVSWNFELARTGAIPGNSWLVFVAYHVVCFAAVSFMVALWRSACLPENAGDTREITEPLDVLIWPFVLATWIAQVMMNIVAAIAPDLMMYVVTMMSKETSILAILIAQIAGGAYAVIHIVLSALIIPFFVFVYIRHNRSVIRPGAPLALTATVIAVVQIALLIMPMVLERLSPLVFGTEGMGILALTLTAMALGKANSEAPVNAERANA